MKDLSLHLLDIARNSVVAGATLIQLSIMEDPAEDRLVLTVTDNGRGMSPEILARVTDPFYTTRTTRKVGLGLSLLKANCENTGGHLQVTSEPGKGTRVIAEFQRGHLDRPPLGNPASTVATLLMSEEDFELEFEYTLAEETFRFTTADVRDSLDGDVDFRDFAISDWISEYIRESMEHMQKSLLSE